MFGWLLFLHIAGVAFWLGAAVTISVLQRKTRDATESAVVDVAHGAARTIIHGVVNPSALVVLVTGVAMIVQMGFAGQAKPFWLLMMERGGGMLVLLSVGLTTWQMRNATRSSNDATRQLHLTRLSNSLAGIGVGVLAVILVVALRLH